MRGTSNPAIEMHDLVSTYSPALRLPLGVRFLPVDSCAGSLSSLSRLGVHINIDSHVGDQPESFAEHENGHLSMRLQVLE